MAGLTLRPRTDSMLREWGGMIHTEASGPGYDFNRPRQAIFEERVNTFCADPNSETFDAIWSSESATEHANPGGMTIRNTFDGDIDDLRLFVESLRSASEYNQHWEERFRWVWALWELFTRINDTTSVILTSETSEALSWFGVQISGSFRDRIQQLRKFEKQYRTLINHSTKGTLHEKPIKVELDELFRTIQTLGKDEIAPQLKGPHGDFYRYLYGGSGGSSRTEQVHLVDIEAVSQAYALGKAHGAYEDEEKPEFWGGTHWETWKESYAAFVDTEIQEMFTLDDLTPDDIDPLFEAITDADGSNLGRPVATFVMGAPWGKYVWDDIVDHFRANPDEASQVLSLFFDRSYPVMNRLEAFREHTIHITETESRSPGSIERMATSLLMFVDPQSHLGLPPSATGTFLEEKSTLPKYKSGFRPRQYRSIIGPLRGLRDEIDRQLQEYDCEGQATMLDVHSLIWIYDKQGNPDSDKVAPT